MNDESPRSESLPPGYDEDDFYDDLDLETLPGWWRTNAETFRNHKMRPYRPPKLADGQLLTEVVEELEAKYDVEISLVRYLDGEDPSWRIQVDGTEVTSLHRVRNEMGRSVYSISSDEFVSIIEDVNAQINDS